MPWRFSPHTLASVGNDGFCQQRGQEFGVMPHNEVKDRAGVDACPDGAIKIL